MPTVPDQVEAEENADIPYNAADPEMVNAARKKHARWSKQRLTVVEALMQHEDGRRFLWELIQGYNPYGEFVIPGDTHGTYFNWGMRNAGMLLLQDCMQFPALFVVMSNENKNRK